MLFLLDYINHISYGYKKNQGVQFCLSLKLKQQSIIILTNNLCKKS